MREGVDVEEAKKLLAGYFMGRHLQHAPTKFLETITLAGTLDLWKERDAEGKPAIVNIPYTHQGSRGK